MSKKIAAFLIAICLSIYQNAFADKIAVIVNSNIITESEIADRVRFMLDLQDIKSPDTQTINALKEISVQSLIDEVLIKEDSAKNKITISEREVDEYILKLEETRKLPRNFYFNKFNRNKDVYRSFIAKVKSEIAKSRLVNRFASQIEVSESEVEDIAQKYAGKDSEIELRKYSVTAQNNLSTQKLLNIQHMARDCSYRHKDKSVKLESIQNKLSELPLELKLIIQNLRLNDFSIIINSGDDLVMYQVCSKKILGISQSEFNHIFNILANQSLGLKFAKHLETLRNNSYIKRM
ncbi:MAG: SurA N-terminal domain-containing protein [Rickettsiaceae bacterium]|nr:SurA N-terminal domain-containing protein [Rickettsiaceae bacterium]